MQTVLQLRTLGLAAYDNSRRNMGEANCGIGLVNVLTACARRTVSVHVNIGFANFHIDFFGFGENRNGCRRSMHATLRFGIGNALHTVHATFKFESAVNAIAFDENANFFVAADSSFGRILNRHLPAHTIAVTAIHPEKIARKKGGFIATGSCANFESCVAKVPWFFRNHQNLQLVFEFCNALFKRRNFFFGGFGKFGIASAESGFPFGEIARKLDIFACLLAAFFQAFILLLQFRVKFLVGDDFWRRKFRFQFFVFFNDFLCGV